MQVGDVATRSFLVDEALVRGMADLVGDRNPIHLDADYAASTRFGKRIAHGALLVGFLSTLLGTELPGPGAIYLSQELSFLAPVFYDERIEVRVELQGIDAERGLVRFECRCSKEDGTVVAEGSSLLKPRSSA